MPAKYQRAPYMYLAVQNGEAAYREFIAQQENPKFLYGNLLNESDLQKRATALEKDIVHTSDVAARTFYENRLAQTQFVLLALHFQSAEGTMAKRLSASFREMTATLFGTPRIELASEILTGIEARANKTTDRATKADWEYIAAQLGAPPHRAQWRPNEKLFTQYRSYFKRYASWIFKPKSTLPQTLRPLLRRALQESGAAEKGWKVNVIPGRHHAKVAYTQKHIEIGSTYEPLLWKGTKRVVVHEVYGHVNRSLYTAQRFDTSEAEGVAVLLEQLLSLQFRPRRTLRYLAIAIAWGVFGEPRDFHSTFEIIWRALRIISGYNKEVAMQKAFYECLRAFRGGRPDLPGVVFTKDIAYYEGNQAVWKYLAKENLSYEAFIDILEGRRVLPIGNKV